ncbi:hypothetical protein SAMD00019534_126810, partial [Acytostelium subglobosum LB1]|uniref:hypothetical protein n=1 Tax=Acytostelium subglobosum LB1 TaxID=1410327 RepID=UPI00064512D7
MCNYCGKHQFTLPSTSNGWRHLSNPQIPCHLACGIDWEEVDANTKPDPNTNWLFKQDVFSDLLVKWMLVAQVAYSMVERPEFRSMIHSLNPTATVFGADTVKRRVMEMFNHTVNRMAAYFRHLDSKVSFCVDGWTSPNNMSFLGITAHWVDNRKNLFKPRRMLLAMVKNSDHSGAHIAQVFTDTLNKYDLM